MNGTLINKDGDWWVSFVFKVGEDLEYNELPIHNTEDLEDPIVGDDITFSPMIFLNNDDEQATNFAFVRKLPQNLRDDYILSQSQDPKWIEGAKWMRDHIWYNIM